jgi:Zn-dependent peptidase ImmA (M78 family)
LIAESYPEEKAARRVLQRYGLTPPIDVRQLAEVYADVEEDRLPVSGDAVVIRHPKGHVRPLIILNNRALTAGRGRFTLAHELGHLLIPGHYGTIACHVDQEEIYLDNDYKSAEAEANRFAAELLMPTDWVLSTISDSQNLEETYTRIQRENVSHEAARIKLLKCLSAGHVCAEFSKAWRIQRIDSTKNTILNPDVLSSLRGDGNKLREALDSLASDRHIVEKRTSTLIWWRISYEAEIPEIQDERNSSEILLSLLSDLYDDPNEVLHYRYVINGVVGGLNSVHKPHTAELFFGLLKIEFDKFENQEIVQHPDFNNFLVKKIYEVFEKRRRSLEG